MLEIGKLTGQSTATISRLISQARDLGIVTITVTPADSDMDGLSTRLSEALDTAAHVVPGTAGDPVRTSRLCGAEAATVVAKQLPYAGTVAWSAGHTIAALVTSLRAQQRTALHSVPAIGGYDPVQPHLDTNALVRLAAARLGGPSHLLLAPATTESAEARRILLEDPTILSTTTRWNDIDAFVFSSSAPADAVPTGFSVMANARGRDRSELIEAGFVGDALGHLFTLEGSFHDDKWSEQLIAMSLEQMKQVRTRIAVVAGIEKTLSVIGLARTRIPTLIVTDEPTARSVLSKIEGGA
ncbi:sugar-binding transcriptional regulator [Humidisolicoccus flavus]|uniref:sugar-binding transcriptional regulator n=1 Tax=Humidisolicoccus flavus TaxID=3111414 RepID=UPI00324E22F2